MWAVVTAGAVAAVGALPDAWSAVAGGSTYDEVLDLLVAACGTGLALALGWLWVIATLTVAGLLPGRVGPRGGATRRLVLLACGIAVVAGTSVPAMATGGDGGDGRDLLVGLTLPERAVAPAHQWPQIRPHVQSQTRATVQARAHPQAPPTYVVRPGDSLSSIAHDHPGDAASVARRWRAIWLANRDVVGDDPDLILPGQALRLPMTHPNSDGDR